MSQFALNVHFEPDYEGTMFVIESSKLLPARSESAAYGECRDCDATTDLFVGRNWDVLSTINEWAIDHVCGEEDETPDTTGMEILPSP